MATPQKGAVRKVAATPEKSTTPVKSPEQKKSKTGQNHGGDEPANVPVGNLSSAFESAVGSDPPKSLDGTPTATRLHLNMLIGLRRCDQP